MNNKSSRKGHKKYQKPLPQPATATLFKKETVERQLQKNSE